MAVYFITGKLGSGKSLICAAKIFSYLSRGRPVATNLDIFPNKFYNRNKRNMLLMRLPDHPTCFDLDCIGRGRPEGSKDESLNGALVLDECGTWFNAQDWQNPKNKALINWMLHARKLGWDIYFLVQHIELVNSQARNGLAEHTAFCSRSDRLMIPFIGFFISQLELPIKLPQIHVASVHLGVSQSTPKADTWIYRGREFYSCYDTEQIFDPNYEHGTYCHLTPWHLRGRYLKPRGENYNMRITKIIWRKYSRPAVAAISLLLGSVASYGTLIATQTPEQIKIAQLEQKIDNLEHPVDPKSPGEVTPQISVFKDLILLGHTSSDNANYRFYFNHPVLGDIDSTHESFNEYTFMHQDSCLVRIAKADDVHFVKCGTRFIPEENLKKPAVLADRN